MARASSAADQVLLSEIASRAAREAVQLTFQNLGINISTPEAVIEAQEMFLGLRVIQRDWKAFRNRFWSAVAALVATGIGSAIVHFSRSATPPL